MAHPTEETSFLVLGGFLLANPVYLSVLRKTVGIGYVDSPIMTHAGVAYVGIGAVLLGFRYAGSDVTFRRAGFASLGGVALFLVYAMTTGYGPFSVSAYTTEMSYWLPRVVLVSLLFPLGVADARLQRLFVGVGIAVAIFAMFLDSFLPSSHGGFSGPLFAVVYTGAFTIGGFVVGYPLYHVGKLYQRQQQQSGRAA